MFSKQAGIRVRRPLTGSRQYPVRDSDPRSSPCKGAILAAELTGQRMVRELNSQGRLRLASFQERFSRQSD